MKSVQVAVGARDDALEAPRTISRKHAPCGLVEEASAAEQQTSTTMSEGTDK